MWFLRFFRISFSIFSKKVDFFLGWFRPSIPCPWRASFQERPAASSSVQNLPETLRSTRKHSDNLKNIQNHENLWKNMKKLEKTWKIMKISNGNFQRRFAIAKWLPAGSLKVERIKRRRQILTKSPNTIFLALQNISRWLDHQNFFMIFHQFFMIFHDFSWFSIIFQEPMSKCPNVTCSSEP